MAPKAYKDQIPPSENFTAEKRQENAAISHEMVVEDIADGYIDAAAGWQNQRSVFYARARYCMGLREADYDL
ncbi:hypothetical protein EVB71_070 [Rhizobium phage RHph_Y55]|nr:hypothetical protein EVB71_070 [Rhizobium phage RHph_Y55]